MTCPENEQQLERNWLQEWWAYLGPGLQAWFIAITSLSIFLGVFLLITTSLARTSQKDVLQQDGLIVLYPRYIPLRQTRELVIRASREISSVKLELPVEIVVRSQVGGPFQLGWDSQATHQEIFLESLSAGTEWTCDLYNLGASGYLDNAELKIELANGRYLDVPITLEGVWVERLRVASVALLSALILSGMSSWLWTTFRHHQERRERDIRMRFRNFRDDLSKEFSRECIIKAQKLRPYLSTFLRTEGGPCLEKIFKINELEQRISMQNGTLTDIYSDASSVLYEIARECPEWVPAALSWLEHIKSSLESRQNIWFLGWLRSLLISNNVDLSVKQRERIQSLLQEFQTTSMYGQHDNKCKWALYEAQHSNRPKQKLLFPEPVLDALHPETQYWLFGNPSYFWPHPLFKNLSQWIRQQSSRLSETRVIQIAGVEASGRTTFALAISEYFPDSDYLGVYMANPQEESDFRQAWATRLLDFVCCHASDLGLIQPTLQDLLFTLWLSLWPRSVLRARLHRCWFRWSSSDSEAHSDLAGISKVAQYVLQLWLEALDGFNLPTPLSHSAWWTALTEALFFIHEVRPWKGLIIAVDWDNDKPPLGDWLSTLDAIANILPVTWLVFTRTSLDLSSDVAHRYNLLWTPEDLVEMMRHRKIQVYGPNPDDKPPPSSEIAKWAQEANGSPRRMGELYLAWYRQSSKQTDHGRPLGEAES